MSDAIRWRRQLAAAVGLVVVCVVLIDRVDARQPAAASTNDAEVQDLVARTQTGNTAFIHGRFEEVVDEYYTSQPDLNVLGPFGGARTGPIPIGLAKGLWAQFKGGSTTTEVLAAFKSGDLIVLSQIERQEVLFQGDDAPQDWSLRVTLVYRREPEGWRIVHRHADPLVGSASVQEAKALARDQ